jgi:Na+/H+-dicarboxylate symporter
MKKIFKLVGLTAGMIGAVMILLGTIGFFTGELFNVANYATYFWYAPVFFLFGIFGIVASMVCTHGEK